MQMMSANGHKAFHGRMLVQLAPAVKDVAPFVEGPCDWIYVPETNMWHSNVNSYYADVCTPLFDDWKES